MSSRNRKYIVDVLSSAGAKRFAVPSSTEKASFRAFAWHVEGPICDSKPFKLEKSRACTPEKLFSGKFAKRGERCHDETCTRWFFIRYVTLKRCCFFQICSFFVFSRSILCLNLSLLATLVLSSEDVSYRCARARKHLQSSFLCIICSWTTPREEEISRPHRPRP